MIASPSALILSTAGKGSGGGGGGAMPGGTPTELQFNAGSGTFGGANGSSVDSVGNIAIAPTAAGTALTLTQFDSTSNALTAQDTTGDYLSFYITDNIIDFTGADVVGDSLQFYVSANSALLEFSDASGGAVNLQTNTGVTNLLMTDADAATLMLSPSLVGFFSATPVGQQIVTGTKLPSDTVMASLLTALANLGLIIDSTT